MTSGSPQTPSEGLSSLADMDWLGAASVQTVLQVLEQSGFSARVVGGAVRNALLGKKVRDVDVATTALPDQVIASCEGANLRVVATGLKHGTVTVVVNAEPIEVTTLREDVTTDGRHAEVRFTTGWEADASRRDFTINALYCDRTGQIFDPLGGLPDITTRTIRFIGNPNARIREDYLRILRFFRFFADYGEGEIDKPSLLACVRGRQGLRQLSGERLRQEMLKLLVAPRALAALEAMCSHGIMGEILPVVPRLNHLARMIGANPDATATLRLACMSVATHEDVDKIAQKLRLSNDEREDLAQIANAQLIRQTPTIRNAKRWLYKSGARNYRHQITFMQSRSFTGLGDPAWLAARELADHWIPPTFPLSGRHALEMGSKPGPHISRALAMVEEQWIASNFTLQREQLLQYLATALSTMT